MKITHLLLVVCFVFLLASCGLKLEKAIIGKWSRIGSEETIEFYKEGTVNIIDEEMPMAGNYKFIDDNSIRLDLGGLGELVGPIICDVSISEDELILTHAGGEVAKYRRVR